MGYPGSRSAELHEDSLVDVSAARLSPVAANRFYVLRWLGVVGTLLMGLGGLGGGALPVVGNPYNALPGGAVMAQMLQASSAVVLLGVALVVTAWLLMGPFVGAGRASASVRSGELLRTLVAWVIPLCLTAPLFTQDIYSYLAQGSVVRQGLDPYSAGAVELLGSENHLVRSVPFIWANSPSPYGPVALGVAAAISWLTNDSIVLGVLAHRAVALVGIAAATWALLALSRRCGVTPATAVWLGMLNPLTLLHLIGGIHNEALMLGLVLVGVEVGLRALDAWPVERGRAAALFIASGAAISSGGMVKVTGFIALGFIGMALARSLRSRLRGWAIPAAVAVQTAVLVASISIVTALSGIGLGWVTGQGGAASIRSWLSITTDIGVSAGFIGSHLGLGDHTDAMMAVTRGVGLVVSLAFMARLLWATYRGTIHPLGGLGVSTLVLVILFPVVHPWYPLWAILPLAAWANRRAFRIGVAIYSAVFSFLVLPRGLALPPGTVFTIYASAAVAYAVLVAVVWWWYSRRGHRSLA
ncbi:polyprenol phosphomannose-dependent alpha 1,6 mannosyltransferase MptB [Corynebacterium sp. LK2510]|uniref:polyprenol phosphomannose-dependent alpha 1,6 mannosyltransferase MptB n=1 Tax=Corynebacterium sp. LK2510 TaxID=3110472 RepID=UPI0034CF36D2